MPHEIVDPRKVVVELSAILDEVGVSYFITGGFAVSVWGRPRATFDIDIVVELVEPKVQALARTLRRVYKAGYIDELSVKDAIRHHGEFNFIDPLTGVKIDFWVSERDAFSLSKSKRKIAKKIGGKNVYFISPEDLILSKLVWCRISESAKQLEDIESILKISGAKLDKRYIKIWSAKLDVSEIFSKIKGSR